MRGLSQTKRDWLCEHKNLWLTKEAPDYELIFYEMALAGLYKTEDAPPASSLRALQRQVEELKKDLANGRSD